MYHPRTRNLPLRPAAVCFWSNMTLAAFRFVQACGRWWNHWQRNSSQHDGNRIKPIREIWIQSEQQQLWRVVRRYSLTVPILEPLTLCRLYVGFPGSVIACIRFTNTKKILKIVCCLLFRNIFLFHLCNIYNTYSWNRIVKWLTKEQYSV
jgi:hypothetical protein